MPRKECCGTITRAVANRSRAASRVASSASNCPKAVWAAGEIGLPSELLQLHRGLGRRRAVEMAEQTMQAMGRKDQLLRVLLHQRAQGPRHPGKPILAINRNQPLDQFLVPVESLENCRHVDRRPDVCPWRSPDLGTGGEDGAGGSGR